MGVQVVEIEEFLKLAKDYPILDVRSPGEYSHAHIPGAISFPLFSDEERAKIGTLYKQESREAAVREGLDIFGPNMRRMTEQAEAITGTQGAPQEKTLLIHCWRGGMRSGGVAWLLDLYGFKVFTLEGGYKVYRNWVLNMFEKRHLIRLVGGYTGSGKTSILQSLKKKGHQVIDLEALASHKGSAFGNIGMPDQPTPEMFENLVAMELYRQNSQNQEVWLEDESQRLGTVNIPNGLWQVMLQSSVSFVHVPFEKRLEHIVSEYGTLPKDRLVNAITRISKKLGGLEAKNAITYLEEGKTAEAFSILLKYYDKYYEKSLHKKPAWQQSVSFIDCADTDADRNADTILGHNAATVV